VGDQDHGRGGARGPNRVAVLLRPGSIVIEDRPMPEPGAGEVLVEVGAVGVCGSDVHYYEHGRIGSFVVESPLVLGHESAGSIVGVGPGSRRAVGQRVAIEPGRPCGACAECRSGSYNLCGDVRFFGTPPVDGAFARYVVVHDSQAFVLPDIVGLEAGALVEPLSVGIWACRKARMGLGSRVLVTGAGSIGLCVLMVAQASGAADITVVDPLVSRRERARKLGAAVADPSEAAAAGPFDAFIECSGSEEAVQLGIELLGPLGVAVVVGMGPDVVGVPLPVLQRREITLTGTFRYAGTYPDAVALLAAGKVDPTGLVDARFSLEEVEAALRATADDPKVVKAVVLPGAASLDPAR
jgi:L-iditol 2-dehydrogenase